MSVSVQGGMSVGNESATFKGMSKSLRWLASLQIKPVLVQVNWLLGFLFFYIFFFIFWLL